MDNKFMDNEDNLLELVKYSNLLQFEKKSLARFIMLGDKKNAKSTEFIIETLQRRVQVLLDKEQAKKERGMKDE